jgi:hypothetical protein
MHQLTKTQMAALIPEIREYEKLKAKTEDQLRRISRIASAILPEGAVLDMETLTVQEPSE